MKLTVPQLRYMMALQKLDHGDKIRCTDLAKELCVKKSSVCGMLCRLENMGQKSLKEALREASPEYP